MSMVTVRTDLCNAVVCKFWIRVRLLPVPLGVHQPLHKILSAPGVQVLAVVTGKGALGMALVFSHQIGVIKQVCLGS